MRPSSTHSTAACSSLTQYRPPEWSSPCERPVVPDARSPFSTRMASMPRRLRSRSPPAPADPPPMTTTPVELSGIYNSEGGRTDVVLPPHPTGPFLPVRLRLRAGADRFLGRLFFDPAEGPLHRLLPSGQPGLALLFGGLGLEHLVHLPVLAQLVEGAPEPGGQSGAVGRAQRGRFLHRWPDDVDAE